MSFEKLLRIPIERIAVLIGKGGNVKSKIEDLCFVTLEIDGENGEVLIHSEGNVENIQPFKAMEIVTAIGRGFSPEKSMDLLKEDNSLHVIDLRDFVGKSNTNIERIKGRIIGERGRARKNMENLTGTHICVYGKTVSIIGNANKLRLAVDAISSISNGNMHRTVYSKLEAANRKNKQEKMRLWENQDVNY